MAHLSARFNNSPEELNDHVNEAAEAREEERERERETDENAGMCEPTTVSRRGEKLIKYFAYFSFTRSVCEGERKSLSRGRRNSPSL